MKEGNEENQFTPTLLNVRLVLTLLAEYEKIKLSGPIHSGIQASLKAFWAGESINTRLEATALTLDAIEQYKNHFVSTLRTEETVELLNAYSRILALENLMTHGEAGIPFIPAYPWLSQGSKGSVAKKVRTNKKPWRLESGLYVKVKRFGRHQMIYLNFSPWPDN